MPAQFSTDPKFLGKKIKGKMIKALNKQFMLKAGNELSEDIRRRTRLGFGVKDIGRPRRKLKPLAQITKIYRREFQNKMSSLTKPSRSNLTFTGQLLDSLKAVKSSTGKVTIDFVGIHKDIHGKRMKNIDLANEVTSKGRPFLGPTNRELQRFRTKLINQIEKFL